ncbi:alkaline phosphatase [Polaribacter reichenbachii]|uniref:Alkaline phosphatase n=1 Tax=Polaribacter reichenbachii TaxID=996801 RepID=A0A1B8TWC7_9FLAO|nr:alkaline phosphatase PafA [Polaribacter reichenbachii]APZ45026.1 alkaline phosphatase [Polaribacter reichenbachii]AUC18889.1 alkaline phosphatase [Polaribacter reichenbachii]OBY63953.1 alkaline phosphatase [Polaribacter reichenbachii]
MKKNIFLLSLSLLFFFGCKSNETTHTQPKPKLVVGIVVDQMRYDYLTRFYDRYSENGFKRLLNNGFSLENAHYNLIPTYTAVGHTSIYTGTTPSNHGIISNNWYDKFLKKSIYCVDDANYNTIGNDSNDGRKSPHRMYSTTVTDQLKLAQNMNGKTIGVAIKDRSSILPAGHTADAAYWYYGKDKGDFISSSFYIDELPKWVVDFNNTDKAESYVETPWETLYDIDTYTNSIVDDNIFERKFKGETTTAFPHDIPTIKEKNGNLDILKAIPNGNSFTTDFAKAAIVGENLGKSNYTDFLAISFSSTDYVGHQFGPASKEIEDTYLRLDKDLADLFSFLDQQVGKDKYTIFLTADHAVVNVPAYLQSLKIPAHYLDTKQFRDDILSITQKYFNSKELIENVSNYQIFFDKKKIESLGLDKNKVADKIVEEIVNFEGIYKAVTAKTLQTTHFSEGIMNSLQNGYNQKFSGDVLMIPFPGTLASGRTGTSHGSGYSYDTHVPIIFYGNGIKQGVSKKRYNITDIAPTIANLLKIEAPNSSSGKIVDEALK